MPGHYVMIRETACGEAWKSALLEVFFRGVDLTCQGSSSQAVMKTRDATVMMVVDEPLSKPRLARGDLFGIASIKQSNYVGEVVDGVLDHKIGKVEVIEGNRVIAVPYTYHDRLTNWKADPEAEGIDQLSAAAEYLKENRDTRRSQAITWVPTTDLGSSDPPCLQRLYFRVIDGRLDMHSAWRSNDMFKAWGSNTYAMVEIMKTVAERIGVPVGRYIYFGNSLHIYEDDWGPSKPGTPTVYDYLTKIVKRGELPERYTEDVMKLGIFRSVPEQVATLPGP